MINVPSLQHLSIQMLKGYEYCLIENAPELVDANIINVSHTTNETIMGSLKSARRLSLDLSPLEVTLRACSLFFFFFLFLYTTNNCPMNRLHILRE